MNDLQWKAGVRDTLKKEGVIKRSDFGTWPYYSPSCRKDVDELLRKGGSLSAYRANKDYGSGPAKDSWAWRLEREIEKRFKVKHAVAVNSGTAALHGGLSSLDLRGGEVITTPYSFSATVAAIILAGGTPVFADVDPYTFCITKETVKRVITKRTKAILPVHLFGGLADVGALRSFGIPVVEDACQAVGARYGGTGVFSGTFGVAGCYSFNGTKNLPCGEGGALVTNSAKIAEKARLLMNHGENFGSMSVGLNYRMNEVTACIAYHGLLELGVRNQRRKDLVRALEDALGCLPRGSWNEHVWYVYPFRVEAGMRHRFAQRMKRMGISVGEGYITPPLHKYPAFRKYQRCPLPVVEELSSKTLCIFSHVRPPATEEDMRYTADCMRGALSG